MITLRFVSKKICEEDKKNITKENIKQYLYSYYSCDNIKIVNENNNYIATIYDDLSDENDIIYLNNYGYVFFSEFEDYKIEDLIEAFNILTYKKNFFNNIVNIFELKNSLFNLKNKRIDEECIEKIFKNKANNNNNNNESKN